jgi:hypothetical protein
VDRRGDTLSAIATLWTVGEEQVASALAGGGDYATLSAIFLDLAQVARAARLSLEAAADRGEPEPLRQARVVFRMIEAAAEVCSYCWTIGDRGYVEDAKPWAELGGRTIAMLPELRAAVDALPDE